jgi:hypothetical protein
MEASPPGGQEEGLKKASDYLARSIEFLTHEDTFNALLQLQKARAILDSLSAKGREGKVEVNHDWAVIDPYTAQCRLCGKRRPLRAEDRTLMPLAFE